MTAGSTSSSAKLTSPRSPTTSKRSLSRRTIANITPNHNPNFTPHSPGKTPEAVPVNSSPSAKRSRRVQKALPSPVSTGALLRASSEGDRLSVPPRVNEDCNSGKQLEYGDDVDMHASSPGLIVGNNPQKPLDPLNVPEHSPLTGSRVQHSMPGAAHGARSSRMTPPSVRGSASLMRVPECSEVGGEQEGAADDAAGRGAADAERRSLRKSLLSIDPMRVSYGTDGLVSLAGVRLPLSSAVASATYSVLLHIHQKLLEAHSAAIEPEAAQAVGCLLYTSPSPRDRQKSRMPSSA